MASGRLKHVVSVIGVSTTRDAFGKPQEAVAPIFRMKCNVQVITGTERVQQGVELDQEFISVLARHDTRLKNDHHLRWEGKDYIVRLIRPDDRKMKMIITASRELRNE